MHRQGYHESIINQMMWGHQGTRMMQAYTHLTGSDIDREVLRVHGLPLISDESQECLKARQCVHCKAINGPLSRYCATCGQPLTAEEERCQKEIVQEIESHPLYLDRNDICSSLGVERVRIMKDN